jgi:hypothetical protein
MLLIYSAYWICALEIEIGRTKDRVLGDLISQKQDAQDTGASATQWFPVAVRVLDVWPW